MRILICAEDAVRAADIEDGLNDPGAGAQRGRHIVHRVDALSSLLPSIATTDPHAVVVDLRDSSPAAVALLTAAARAAKRPIVAFVDRFDPDAADAAIDAGIAAFVYGGFDKARIDSILTIAVRRYASFARLEAELERARSALRDRKLIDRAKAILMSRDGLTEAEAYALLRRSAMNQNRTIADLARAIIDASTLLGERR